MSTLDRWLREGWLRPIDHALGAALQRLTPGTPDDVALAAALASRALAFGHSRVPLDRVADLCAEIAPDRAPALPDRAGWERALAASAYVARGEDDARGKPLVFAAGAIALRRHDDYEAQLASALRALKGRVDPAPDPVWLRERIAALFAIDADHSPDRQALAAALAQIERVVLLTGGPGTGKTTTVARVLVLAFEAARRRGETLRVALAAPTGKAAARLSESLRESYAKLLGERRIDEALRDALPDGASTLHRLLGGRPDSVRFRHDAKNPLAADLVVVDEASMVDLPLMCKLANALPPQARLILLGDRDQLPSVETGDVLAALCDAAGSGVAWPARIASQLEAATGASVATRDDAAPLVRIELDRNRRQSDALDVSVLSTLIRAGDAAGVVSGLRRDAYRGVRWRSGRDAALADFVLDHALPHYRALAQAPDVASALAMLRRHRVLAAVREGDAGSRTLNARIALALQRPGAREDAFFHGRPVMIRENSYRHGLYNGDVGLVWDDGGLGLRVWFDTASGPRAWLPAALPAHESAFALTVHKSQGSEFDDVLFVLPERSVRVLSRELVYTAITRARSALTISSNEDVLADAISRRAQRWSGLAGRLCRSDD
ncbi:MAG TPA: exodeoxyribonuclease V subunit alpha [Rhodanobacteraceae bacterium]|nr:exodeoxyribonuclease V subunit alpha [Rhodanobacteraceae bacterium]